ncbi:MAG: DUF4178 domain-containing protein [Clostridia bacterium]|nr:DUF4178 domain-containing protein [Clostridia bacterium]
MLKKGQVIYIRGEKNVVINMIEFKEGTWVWQEYEIVNVQTHKHTWLSIEPDENNRLEYYVYEPYRGFVNESNIEFNVNEKKYKLYESGNAYVKSYFGNADVDIHELCNFFDYLCEEDNTIISVENWDGEREVSIGYKIYDNELNVTEEIDKKNAKKANTKRSNDIYWCNISIFYNLYFFNGSRFINK